jgi:hypothetical protein
MWTGRWREREEFSRSNSVPLLPGHDPTPRENAFVHSTGRDRCPQRSVRWCGDRRANVCGGRREVRNERHAAFPVEIPSPKRRRCRRTPTRSPRLRRGRLGTNVPALNSQATTTAGRVKRSQSPPSTSAKGDVLCPFGGLGPHCPLHDSFLHIQAMTTEFPVQTTLAGFATLGPEADTPAAKRVRAQSCREEAAAP